MTEQEEDQEVEKGYEKALRVNLDKDITDELEYIKSYRGFVMDSDLIRVLIRAEKRRIEIEETELKILKSKATETEK